MNNFKKLEVWQLSRLLAVNVIKITKGFPDDERFILVSQIRRCAISIPSNIAEGAGRGSKKDFNHFLNIAAGSLYELETQLIISFDLDYISQENFDTMISDLNRVGRLINGLKKSLT